jgi:hypothetical protein
MSKGGSAPPPPEESQHSKTLARIANERWADYQHRFQPVETAYRDSVQQLDSDTNYAGAMAKGIAAANTTAGNQYHNAAMQLAAGGSASPLLQLGSSAMNALADGVYGGAAGQRENFLKQAQGVAKLGNGTIDQTIGTFKAVSDADTSRINSNFANLAGSKIAEQNANTALLGELTQLGTMYGAHNGWFSGKDYMGIDSSGKFNGVRGRSSGWEMR